jgi:FdhD protein
MEPFACGTVDQADPGAGEPRWRRKTFDLLGLLGAPLPVVFVTWRFGACAASNFQATRRTLWSAEARLGPGLWLMKTQARALSPAVVLPYIATMAAPADDYLVRPDPLDPRLTERVKGVDQTGAKIETSVTVERALTIFLNAQEIVTAMTINDYPEYLALGYLLNQNMLMPDDVVTSVDYDDELSVVVVRTKRKTDYEKKLKKKVQTSGCAQGTVFGDLMEALENVTLPRAQLRTSWLYALTHKINTTPSLYLEAGAIHGCVLAVADRPLVYMEDVGRHNAVDKIAGWMFKHRIGAADKIFYTTGRLTSEMVIKTVRMGIPILISRSGFTAWGVELARKANLTLIGRARGKRFIALAGEDRIVFDQDLAYVEDESAKHQRKAAVHDE